MSNTKQRQVHLVNIEVRDALDGGHPVVKVGDVDLGPSCLGYTIDRTDMGRPPVLIVRIACNTVNEARLIERASAVAG